MKQVESTGKNIEQAIENALFELRVPREEVDIKILEQGGFFKKAKVLVTVSEDYKEKKKVKEEDIESLDDLKAEIKNSFKDIKEDKPKEEIKEEIKKEVKKEEKTKTEKAIKNDIKNDPEEFLNGLLKVLKIDAKVNVITDGDFKTYSIDGENVNELIGYRGDALFALSYLTQTVAGKEAKLRVDVAGYRKKREETLTSLANRMADKAIKTGRYVKLEPMEASERRIIHMALHDNPNVTTESKGNEPHRYLIIYPKKAE